MHDHHGHTHRVKRGLGRMLVEASASTGRTGKFDRHIPDIGGKQGEVMKQAYVLIFCIWGIVNSASMVVAESRRTPQQQAVQAALATFRDAYSTEIVLGTPLEVNGLQIIPLATVGVGAANAETTMSGAGGLLMPVGVIVVSGQTVRIVQVSKGIVEQLVNALAPIVLENMNVFQGSLSENDISGTFQKPRHRNLSTIYWTVVFLFWLVWLVLAFIIQKLFPDKISTIGTTFRYNLIQISLLGLVGYGVLFFLAMIFTASIIGIPFTFALLILAGILTLFGTIGFAFFIGQESATAFKYHYSDTRFLLIGGVLFGLLGLIPGIGVIIWAMIAVFGFGVIVQMQQASFHKK